MTRGDPEYFDRTNGISILFKIGIMGRQFPGTHNGHVHFLHSVRKSESIGKATLGCDGGWKGRKGETSVIPYRVRRRTRGGAERILYPLAAQLTSESVFPAERRQSLLTQTGPEEQCSTHQPQAVAKACGRWGLGGGVSRTTSSRLEY